MRGAIVAAVLWAGAASGATISTVSYPGAANTCALGIASNGTVVGDYSLPARPQSYTRNFEESAGKFTSVTVHYQGLVGSLYGIDANGEAVGGLFTANGRNARAFSYQSGAVSLIRPPANSVFSVAMGIDDGGAIVGGYVAGGREYGFLLFQSNFTGLRYPGAAFTRATGIAPGGEIVGIAGIGVGGGQRVVGWTLTGGRFAEVAVPGAANTYAAAVDTSGRVYGFTYQVGSGGGYVAQHGFVLAGGSYSAFDVPGSAQTFIQGVTPAGVFVGCSQTGSGWRGFVATP